ncbi:MAG: HAD family hydrolase [Chloroflexota bacterium]
MSQTAVKLIVTDIDGTLLNSAHQLSERNKEVIKKTIASGVKFILASGKTRASAQTIIDALGLNTPGIYLQGLAIYKADGTVSHQKTLDPALARQVITFAEDRGFDVVAFAGDRLLARNVTAYIERLHTDFAEPQAEGVGPLQNLLDDMPVHKLMIIRDGDPRRITALRWQLDRQIDGSGRMVQTALKDSVELLPAGASKGATLRVLLRDLGIEPEAVLAIGDAENDVEMIQLAGIGVAVENADEKLKAAADHVVASNDADGVAEAIERFVFKEATPADTADSAASSSASASDQSSSGEATGGEGAP